MINMHYDRPNARFVKAPVASHNGEPNNATNAMAIINAGILNAGIFPAPKNTELSLRRLH